MRYQHYVVFVFVMGYISVSHIYRMYTDYMGWTLDFTGSQMVLTLKLTSMAFNYYDGNRKDKDNITEEMQRRAIRKLPSLLEFYGFIYFFPTFIAGPSVEISDYLTYMDRSMFKDKACNGQIPSTFMPTMVTLGKAILCVPFLFISNSVFPPSFILTQTFRDLPVLEKIGRIHLHAMLTRFRYYFAWFLTEGSCTACGMGYFGYEERKASDGRTYLAKKFSRFTNVHPLKIETALNTRDVAVNWNIRTSDWLRNYVYIRVTPPGSKPSAMSSVATYATSAFWHGFYPGYYIFFIASFFLTEVGKEGRRKLRPYFIRSDGSYKQPAKLLYDIVGCFGILWHLSFFGLSFLYLGFQQSLILWPQFYYIPHLNLVVAWLVLKFLVPTPRNPTSPYPVQRSATATTTRTRKEL
eukprot:TRINITY_DN3823_c0_g1_i3.p1 TRINITY_DN3823_c0_g1~~TRINITY_DN3823_c0_g1_i3.p1  ORF type:complete len:409 (-),score=88.84 TRINITY_DN3823_c0_g1_i3:104-1330(-)